MQVVVQLLLRQVGPVTVAHTDFEAPLGTTQGRVSVQSLQKDQAEGYAVVRDIRLLHILNNQTALGDCIKAIIEYCLYINLRDSASTRTK